LAGGHHQDKHRYKEKKIFEISRWLMFPLFVKLIKHALLRQSFFGLAWFTIIVAAISVAFASQRHDLVVTIANHFLWLNLWNNWAMLTSLIVLINV
jgi:hypothetical protein